MVKVKCFEYLHSEVGIAAGLFGDGYYDEAVRKASQRFIKSCSGAGRSVRS